MDPEKYEERLNAIEYNDYEERLNAIEYNDYDIPWWEDYDGDIEEEKTKIEERVSKIMDPKKRLEKYEELLNAIEYNEYYAYNPQLKSESCLINLRLRLRSYKDKDIKEFFSRVLKCSGMVKTSQYSAKNILIVNDNKKFTFLNSIKTFVKDEIIEKGKVKMRREYDDEWSEDDEESCMYIELVC